MGLVLLLAVGAGTSFLLGRSLDSTDVPTDEVVEAGEVGFVRLPPLILPLTRQDRVYRYMTLTPSLEVPEGTNISEIRRRIPRLRDAFVREVNGRTVMRGDGSGAVDLDGVKKRLLARARRVVGARNVNEVLLNNPTGQVPRSGSM